jgi:hypothetical protein
MSLINDPPSSTPPSPKEPGLINSRLPETPPPKQPGLIDSLDCQKRHRPKDRC